MRTQAAGGTELEGIHGGAAHVQRARRPGDLFHPAPAARVAVQSREACAPPAEHLAFNTAVSFTTNTNWQSYSGETTMSYLTQMAGLAWHNFTSAAAGLALPWPWRAG
jgi:hypothetical protein